MVQSYTQTYKIPNWGKVYLNLVIGNSEDDSIVVNIFKNEKTLETIYETNNLTEATAYLEGFLEHLVRTNKNIPCPDIRERKKGWPECYIISSKFL